jgi:hypothetical protein
MIEKELEVSRLTGERYVESLIEIGRVYIDSEDDYGRFLKNNLFSSMDEVNGFLRRKEKEWSEKGRRNPEMKRRIHLIRLIGLMDLFYQYGKISENDVKKQDFDLTQKRKLLRDLKILRELENIHLYIHREYILSESNERQWYYVVRNR